jgi:nitroreductase
MTAQVFAEKRATGRISHHPIDARFLERWSPRAYDGSPIERRDLLTILEAGRWAPSAFNYQPWRFFVAQRDTPHWGAFLGALLPFNQAWAKEAAALVVIASDTLLDTGKPEGPQPSRTHSFDAGAAWGQLSLQANHLGYHTRGMAGFDHETMRQMLALPKRFCLEATIAIGRKAAEDKVPEALREREVATDRRPLSELVFSGPYGGPSL